MRSPIRITSVVFGDLWTEITFVDSAKTSTDVVDVEQRLINPTVFSDEIEEIMESLQDLLNKAYVHRRNPVTSFTHRAQPGGVELNQEET